MITRTFSLEQMPDYSFAQGYSLDRIVFFDIETTGLAAEASYLYLIGCAFYKEASFHILQWFSEGPKEEVLLLTSFFEFLKDYDVLLHYNGSGFDIPYLQKKCRMLQLDYSFEHLTSIDIYRRILPYKKVLGLRNLKLKDLETFLKINRKDTFTGGELIQVYQNYLGRKHYEDLRRFRVPESASLMPSNSEILLGQLLLHNEEDIRGLLSICPVLSYVDLFEKPVRILQAGVTPGTLSIDFEISSFLPALIHFGSGFVHLTASGNTANLNIQIYEGELKYFYDNYKDYYYLPAEDYAIHKSLACYVDKDFREKAKPSNCYIKKQGLFAPQYEPVITPYFKSSYQDKLTFLEIHTDYLLREENLEAYVTHIMRRLLVN